MITLASKMNKILHLFVVHQSMKFSTTYKDIKIIVEVQKDHHYLEPATTQLSEDERELLQENEVSYYEIILTLNKTRQYYLCGVLLSSNPETLSEELDEYLIEGGILDELIAKKKPD